MTNETFSAIGMVLTFLASMSATIVSIVSLKYSNKTSKRTGYLNTVTASREKWISSIRENASIYFTQISRICNCKEENSEEIYNELVRYHYAIILHLYKQDKKTHNSMSAIKSSALAIVNASNTILSQYQKYKYILSEEDRTETVEKIEEVIEARKTIKYYRNLILDLELHEAFYNITNIIARERRKQEQEAIKF